MNLNIGLNRSKKDLNICVTIEGPRHFNIFSFIIKAAVRSHICLETEMYTFAGGFNKYSN